MFGWWKKVVFENYANFKGRARRAEYWYFLLVSVLLFIPFYALIFIGAATGSDVLASAGGIICVVFWLGMIVPYLAAIVRRLHDIGKSGWNYFMSLIPIVGPILLLVWLFTDGQRSANQWGDDPKNPVSATFDFDNTNPAI